MKKHRRNNYDVTNTIDVSDAVAVGNELCSIFRSCHPKTSSRPIKQAVTDLGRLFRGEYPGYRACDTFYHDLQHSLDMTLAMTRLAAGHERLVAKRDRLGPERMMAGIITAMYHDSGYIRSLHDHKHKCGAEYTIGHVKRSARFLKSYLPNLGLQPSSNLATRIVHYTGYEIAADHIRLADPKDRLIGYMVGTADLIAQMADRCYLEKCRDRLYPEFVLGGIARTLGPDGKERIVYASGEDMLMKTHSFYDKVISQRLNNTFDRAYIYIEAFFHGHDPYQTEIRHNLDTLQRAIDRKDLSLLSRTPPYNPACERIPELLLDWEKKHKLAVATAAPTPII